MEDQRGDVVFGGFDPDQKLVLSYGITISFVREMTYGG